MLLFLLCTQPAVGCHFGRSKFWHQHYVLRRCRLPPGHGRVWQGFTQLTSSASAIDVTIKKNIQL